MNRKDFVSKSLAWAKANNVRIGVESIIDSVCLIDDRIVIDGNLCVESDEEFVEWKWMRTTKMDINLPEYLFRILPKKVLIKNNLYLCGVNIDIMPEHIEIGECLMAGSIYKSDTSDNLFSNEIKTSINSFPNFLKVAKEIKIERISVTSGFDLINCQAWIGNRGINWTTEAKYLEFCGDRYLSIYAKN